MSFKYASIHSVIGTKICLSLVTHPTLHKIYQNSSTTASRQTDEGKNITSLAEVDNIACGSFAACEIDFQYCM